jgi:hypothetical protein
MMRTAYTPPAVTALLAITLIAGCNAPKATPEKQVTKGWLRDVTASTAVAAYEFPMPKDRPLTLLQTIGNGCALADFNNDGNLDLLVIGAPVALYDGDGNLGFKASPATLPQTKITPQGCAVGDIDNDGDLDVYITGYRTGYLWRNTGSGFEDVTAQSGIPVQPWGTSAAFADIDLDGKTDLIIANYVAYNPDKGTRERCDFRSPNGTTVLGACGPREYLPLRAAVYRNTNGARFTDITKAAGIRTSGRGLGIAALDINQNGKVRIAIANDESPGDLLAVESTKPLKISNVGARSGTAYDMDGKVHGGMGVDWGDYDNDGQFDLAVATFETEPMSLYHSDGPDLFSDVTVPSNTAFPTRSLVTFGLRMVDIDNDGLLDIISTNGHVMDNVQDIKPKSVFKQPSQLLRNIDGKRFEDAAAQVGSQFTTPIVGRGLAIGDINNDGRPDVVTIDSFGGVHIYANENAASGAWIGLKLIGTKSTRDGSGAIVTVKAGEKTFLRHAHTDGSYMSASDGRVIVGLGQVSGPVDVSIRWPSGRTQQLKAQTPGSYITVTEGAK